MVAQAEGAAGWTGMDERRAVPRTAAGRRRRPDRRLALRCLRLQIAGRDERRNLRVRHAQGTLGWPHSYPCRTGAFSLCGRFGWAPPYLLRIRTARAAVRPRGTERVFLRYPRGSLARAASSAGPSLRGHNAVLARAPARRRWRGRRSLDGKGRPLEPCGVGGALRRGKLAGRAAHSGSRDAPVERCRRRYSLRVRRRSTSHRPSSCPILRAIGAAWRTFPSPYRTATPRRWWSTAASC